MIVQAIITKEGTVREVQVVEDELGVGMAQRVAQSVRRWKFEPATLEGKPVDVYYNAKVYVDCGSH